ncbi:phosphotransferase [Rhodoferax sp.]|uniref:phosphotransferase n=1 Tax=Rhodoferax sp. TaxID=50421 RepID=UPI00261A5C1B|nr:phosphotransferase [Rhodoferax sp.]MDD2919498.1 phosphotransferase [Rhodoferax sp.]
MPLTELISNLRNALAQTLGQAPELRLLNDKGLAHWHVRLQGTGLLVRIPKQSQMALGAVDNLRYEAACFERAAPSSHVPRLAHVIAPSPGLPWGALLVEDIDGVSADGPAHIDAIMRALAAIHALPVAPGPARAPLLNDRDPLAGMLTEVRAQARYLDDPCIAAPTRRLLQQRLQLVQGTLAQACQGLAPRLITFDAHPGNFLITPNGKAVLVDLEKCRYSYPPLDLAHATLYTSTSWDVSAAFALSPAQVASAYVTWMLGAGDMAAAYAPAFVPLRELMWLWSVTWCAKWLVQSTRPRSHSAGGEDWSQDNSEAVLIAHVRARVADYLSIPTIERVQAELHTLTGLFA